MRGSTVLAYMTDQLRANASDGITLRPDEALQLVEVLDELGSEFRRLEVIAGVDDDDAATANVIMFPPRRVAR